MLEGVTGNEVRDCRVLQSSGTGILLKQAVQNRIVGSRLESVQGSGLDLSQSAENAILYNTIRDFTDVGIRLSKSDKNLILGNVMEGCATGLDIIDSSAVQVLRNRIRETQLCGLVVSNGESSRFLDNTFSGGSLGIVMAGSGSNKLLRNSVKEATNAGIVLFDSPASNHVSENCVRSCEWGLALAGTARDDVTYNLLSDNEVGALISLSASGARLEGNTFSANNVGLRQQSNLSELDAQWEQLALDPPRAGGTAVPVLTNNVFENSAEYDIVNNTATGLLAAGNRWGQTASRNSATATVAGDVSLEASAWKGTIAVGADSEEVHVLLGRILEMTLSDAGFHVIDLVGIASSARLQQALEMSDVDLIWWIGLESNAEPQADEATPFVLETPAIEGWRVVVSSRLAGRLDAMTGSALAAWWKQSGEQLRFAATSDLTEAEFDAFVDGYGLSGAVRSFTQADDLKQVETLLKLGTVDVAVVRSLKETLTLSGFQAIDDDLQTLEEEPISMVVQPSTLAKYPTLEAPLEDLAGRLTTQELHTLVSRVRLLQESPEDVARDFLESSRSTDNEEGG